MEVSCTIKLGNYYLIIHSDLVLNIPHTRWAIWFRCISRHLILDTCPQGFDSRPLDLSLSPSLPAVLVLHVCIIFQLFPEQLCWQRFMHQSEHSLPPLFSPLTSIFNKMFNCKFKLDKAAEAALQACSLLCILSGIALFHLWMFGSYIMHHLLEGNRFWLFI